jgi:hypothetical protein
MLLSPPQTLHKGFAVKRQEAFGEAHKHRLPILYKLNFDHCSGLPAQRAT